nr:hypothetical protein [Tanacetum cinerariifolium]
MMINMRLLYRAIGRKDEGVKMYKEFVVQLGGPGLSIMNNNVNIDRSAGGMADAFQIPSDLCDEPNDP